MDKDTLFRWENQLENCVSALELVSKTNDDDLMAIKGLCEMVQLIVGNVREEMTQSYMELYMKARLEKQ